MSFALLLILGHLVGDYIFQNSWMASTKGEKSLNGWFAAIIHSLLYTGSVCLLMWNWDWRWVIVVFLSHVFIDHYSTATWWLKNIKGMNKPRECTDPNYTSLYWIVYVVVDNTFHLLLMFGAYALLYIV